MGAKGLQPANNRLICDLRIGFAGNSFTLYGALVCKCGRRNMCNISKAGHLPGLIRVGVAAPVVAFEPSGHDLTPPTRYLLRILDRFSSYAKHAKTFPSCRWFFTRENFSIIHPISFDWQIRKWELNIVLSLDSDDCILFALRCRFSDGMKNTRVSEIIVFWKSFWNCKLSLKQIF